MFAGVLATPLISFDFFFYVIKNLTNIQVKYLLQSSNCEVQTHKLLLRNCRAACKEMGRNIFAILGIIEAVTFMFSIKSCSQKFIETL